MHPKDCGRCFEDIGVPQAYMVDNANEEFKGDFKSMAMQYRARTKVTKPYSPWQQVANAAIKELKHGMLQKQTKMKSPEALWDHGIELEAQIQSHTAHGHPELDGQTPEIYMTCQTSDMV